MIQIIPSIPTNNPKELREKLAQAEGVVDRVSIDIIDGKYADNKTIDPSILFEIETNFKLDYQLMVVEPVNWVEKCVAGKADRIIGHIEKMSNQIEFVGKVQEVGAQVGLAIDLKTPVSAIDETIINDLDIVLVMSVPAGFGGQKFNKKALSKIKKLDKIRSRDDMPYRIHDDGGITLELGDDARREGADEVSIGMRIFEGNLAENIEKYTKAAYK